MYDYQVVSVAKTVLAFCNCLRNIYELCQEGTLYTLSNNQYSIIMYGIMYVIIK